MAAPAANRAPFGAAGTAHCRASAEVLPCHSDKRLFKRSCWGRECKLLVLKPTLCIVSLWRYTSPYISRCLAIDVLSRQTGLWPYSNGLCTASPAGAHARGTCSRSTAASRAVAASRASAAPGCRPGEGRLSRCWLLGPYFLQALQARADSTAVPGQTCPLLLRVFPKVSREWLWLELVLEWLFLEGCYVLCVTWRL